MTSPVTAIPSASQTPAPPTAPLRHLPAPTPPPPRLRKRRSHWSAGGDCPPLRAEEAPLLAAAPSLIRETVERRVEKVLEARCCPTACLGRPAAAGRSGEEPSGGRRAAGRPAPGGVRRGTPACGKGRTHKQKNSRKGVNETSGPRPWRGEEAADNIRGGRPPSRRGAAPRRSPVPTGGREERLQIGDGAVRAGKWRRCAALGTPPASRAGGALSDPGRVPTGGGASPVLLAEGTAVYVTAPRGRALNRPSRAAQTRARRQAEWGDARGPNPVTRKEPAALQVVCLSCGPHALREKSSYVLSIMYWRQYFLLLKHVKLRRKDILPTHVLICGLEERVSFKVSSFALNSQGVFICM
ncbi:translation initiation factor IF-2-like [Tympanuchus pallidicinctus]|uniref:translation initiation factor IF-2-like n=1 Tax=Tympanuchus pallidicinctus TaxID=109042 RepID=UPI002287456D|nr:translation initiation factor IF-2-like [Tympanuchus pallidicinctus]